MKFKSLANGLLLAGALTVGAGVMAPAEADAFCGFYVSGGESDLFNDATQVVLMREGTKTILSMQNNYQGPTKRFAMVVPVPEVLMEENVKTLPEELFAKIDQLSAPRLVEYWERDPCEPQYEYDDFAAGPPQAAGGGNNSVNENEGEPAVKVEAEFEVGEYDVVILSSKESNSLEKWLLDHGYNIPKGASKALAPYIAQGMYFFVAKVNAKKVKFDSKGNALLSPLRFHYNSEDFSLPVRLGLLNAKGTQDLIVHTLGLRQRYKVSNYKNVTIPTNLVVPDRTRKTFGSFYNGLFDYTMEQNRGAVVTEYAWDSAKCDPCAGPTLTPSDLYTLGLDVLQMRTRTFEQNSAEVEHITAVDNWNSTLPSEVRRSLAAKGDTLTQCYNDFLATSPKERSGRISFEFELTPAGTPQNLSRLWNTLGDEALTACAEKYVASIKVSEEEDRGLQRVEIGMVFTHTMRKELISVPTVGWTLTRLHTRYTSKTMTEDLIFEKAKPIIGGVGIPEGKRGKIALEGARFSHKNNFQGRYIILHHDESTLACSKSERSYYWSNSVMGGPSSARGARMKATDSSVAPGTSQPVELSRKMKAAAKRQFRPPSAKK